MNPVDLEKFMTTKKPRDHEIHNWHLRVDQTPCWCGLCHCERCAAVATTPAKAKK